VIEEAEGREYTLVLLIVNERVGSSYLSCRWCDVVHLREQLEFEHAGGRLEALALLTRIRIRTDGHVGNCTWV
jgi:hypothetical protein